MPVKRNSVFVSYSHKDKPWLDAILPQLKAAERYGNFEVWSDLEIREGERWYERIREILDRTKFAVCLVSADFLSSTFCMDEEIPHFLREARKGGLTILPVLIRPCPWETHPWLKRIQMYRHEGRALALGSEADRDVVFGEVASRIFKESEPGYVPPPPPPPLWPAPKQCDISRLPETGSLLFGRDEELNRLDKAWEGDDTNIVVFKAYGGVGKSTLVRVWSEQMAEDNYRGAEAVYAWSFYSQGTSERVTSADLFIAAALEFFGDPDPQKGSPWDRGERLAELVAKHKTLLLLDGMEPLQSGHKFDRGEIKDPALKTLLAGLAERNPGLCVISTREDVTDIEGAIEQVDLEKVSTVAGRALLRIGGVPGTDAELEGTVEEFGNHALALNLLAAFFKWPGQIEDIPELPDIPEAQGRHARRVMAAFVKAFGEGPELDLLRVLGLFDGPVEETVVEALLAAPPIGGLTEHLGREGALAGAQATLRRARMLASESRHNPPRLDCHPLVREHFGAELEHERREAWRAGHGRLSEYYQDLADSDQPSTLEALAPLYAAVAHGSKAGRWPKAFEVYRTRIQRGTFYATNDLRAFGADLAAVSSFFEKPWTEAVAGLTEEDTASLFSQAGYSLRALGHMREAVEPFKLAFEARKVLGNWKDVSVTAVHLSALFATLGEVSQAVRYGRLAVKYADKSTEQVQRIVARATQASAWHQAGRAEKAEALLKKAERLQQEVQPKRAWLYSTQGYAYCDLLLALNRPAQAQERAREDLTIALKSHKLLANALDKLVLGRAGLALGKGSEAAKPLNAAVRGLRDAGEMDDVPRGLLARAGFYRRQGEFERAHRDLSEVHKIASRGGMRLHLTDFHLESARLTLAETDPSTAREHFEKARDLVHETGYHRRDPELAEIEAQVTSAASTS